MKKFDIMSGGANSGIVQVVSNASSQNHFETLRYLRLTLSCLVVKSRALSYSLVSCSTVLFAVTV